MEADSILSSLIIRCYSGSLSAWINHIGQSQSYKKGSVDKPELPYSISGPESVILDILP